MFTTNIWHRTDALRLSHPHAKKTAWPFPWHGDVHFGNVESVVRYYLEFVTRGMDMVLGVIITALSCIAPFILISDNVPSWMSVVAWIYILLMIAVGVMTWKSNEIIAWCDKQLAKKDDKNAP